MSPYLPCLKHMTDSAEALFFPIAYNCVLESIIFKTCGNRLQYFRAGIAIVYHSSSFIKLTHHFEQLILSEAQLIQLRKTKCINLRHYTSQTGIVINYLAANVNLNLNDYILLALIRFRAVLTMCVFKKIRLLDAFDNKVFLRVKLSFP